MLRIKTSEIEDFTSYIANDMISNTDFIKPEYYKEEYQLQQYLEKAFRDWMELVDEEEFEAKQQKQEYWDELEEQRQFDNEQFG